MICWFVYLISPWFERGGNMNNGTGAGVLTFGDMAGYANDNRSFRELTMIR